MTNGFPWTNAPDILAYGFSGFGFLLATLTFLVIKIEAKRPGAPRKGILRVAGVFMGFCLLLAGLSLVLPMVQSDNLNERVSKAEAELHTQAEDAKLELRRQSDRAEAELRTQAEAAAARTKAGEDERARLESRIDSISELHARVREELVELRTNLKNVAEIARFNDTDDADKTITSLRNAFATIQVLTNHRVGSDKQIEELKYIAAQREALQAELSRLNASLAASEAVMKIITQGKGATLDENIALIVAHVEAKAALDEKNKALSDGMANATESLAALRSEIALFDPFRPMVTTLQAACDKDKPDALATVAQEAMLRYERFPVVEKEHQECRVLREQFASTNGRVRELEAANAVYQQALELCKKEKTAPPPVCSMCKGTRQIVSHCARCSGEGETTTTCSECDGEGDIECSTCDGYGGGSCGACNGSGRLWCRYGPCNGCGWSGILTHATCGGSGVLTCGSCKGKERKDCPKCVDGDKPAKCTACKGSGTTTAKCVRCAT